MLRLYTVREICNHFEKVKRRFLPERIDFAIEIIGAGRTNLYVPARAPSISFYLGYVFAHGELSVAECNDAVSSRLAIHPSISITGGPK